MEESYYFETNLKKGGLKVKVDSWFHISFQNGSSLTYMWQYADCLKDQYRNLYFLYNCFNHLPVQMINTVLP